ncbi:hypothetical protein K443DRAFT_539186 [Laccaria amethystina LaAM-08-1]|uniref:Uncharacterized protein n=1 Tax=Laccaria amethystina LaAM-08-1 TaxID=1095629 RepID=A0A0C9WLT5_9AGAR|nr:hypothetical protein K443DRAFT_539186 [Laccaria amethystina LaAM-08-1]
MRCQLRNTHSTNIGGEISLGRRRLEGMVKRRRARPRILWKPIEREREEASEVPDIFGRCNSTLTLCPSQPEKVFFFKPGPHCRLMDDGNLDPSTDHFHHDSSSTRH